jgi:hypothetical protein
MKIDLFHAPYVDDEGQGRHRLAALVTTHDPEDEREMIDSPSVAIKSLEAGETRVLAVPSDVEVGWL